MDDLASTGDAAACDLADMRCVPCRGGVPPLAPAEIEPLLARLESGWRVERDAVLVRTYSFRDFLQGVHFVNAVAEVAEAEGHHPELCVTWGRVTARQWTHKIDGLAESDFVLAAKMDRVYAAQRAEAGADTGSGRGARAGVWTGVGAGAGKGGEQR